MMAAGLVMVQAHVRYLHVKFPTRSARSTTWAEGEHGGSTPMTEYASCGALNSPEHKVGKCSVIVSTTPQSFEYITSVTYYSVLLFFFIIYYYYYSFYFSFLSLP
eukprot:Rmarinus@m.3053